MVKRREMLAGLMATTLLPFGAAPARAAAPLQLLMVVERGCLYCAAWRREVGPGYAVSAQGRAAPIFEVGIDGPWPDGLALARRPRATPTFILLRGGQEQARIEGYPGAASFYADLSALLSETRHRR